MARVDLVESQELTAALYAALYAVLVDLRRDMQLQLQSSKQILETLRDIGHELQHMRTQRERGDRADLLLQRITELNARDERITELINKADALLAEATRGRHE